MISSIIDTGLKIIDKVIPNPEQREKAKLELLRQQQNGDLREIEAQLQSVVAEINGDSWLQRNWRPATMLTFVTLVVAKWMGFTAPGVSEAIELELMNLIQIGLGGYVVGRSAEKVATVWKAK